MPDLTDGPIVDVTALTDEELDVLRTAVDPERRPPRRHDAAGAPVLIDDRIRPGKFAGATGTVVRANPKGLAVALDTPDLAEPSYRNADGTVNVPIEALETV